MQRRETREFGPFQLDLETGELWRSGERVKLSPKPSQALALLVTSPGQLITREAIQKQLWDSDTHVDFEHALNFCIREIRVALGDSATKPQYLETLARRAFDGTVVVEINTRRADTRADREADLAEALAFTRLNLAAPADADSAAWRRRPSSA